MKKLYVRKNRQSLSEKFFFCGFPTYRQVGVRSVRQSKKEFFGKTDFDCILRAFDLFLMQLDLLNVYHGRKNADSGRKTS